ncbi:hypothetical protein FA95DRAFT_1574920 [Auriscalpium vulgare]|uniref:Uncharacterized protein n=1 Tax=Auriscalpium vulgare TaxID=40419 RepID=A0ACB8RIH7_9AGAM|nr:hypothetical protein FA95DRAFT_1574920 [Auriscalpium vulgare]
MPVALPAEIMLLIVNDVSSANDRRSLRAVNRAFCNTLTPSAFRIVGATNRHDSALGLVNLLGSGLAQHVEEVIYRDGAADEDGNAVDGANAGACTPVDTDYGPAVKEPLVRAFSLAVQLPRVTSVQFIFHPRIPRTLHRAREDQLEKAIKNFALVRLEFALLNALHTSPPRLQSLTLINLIIMSDALALYVSPVFRAVSSSLKHLRISTASYLPFDADSGTSYKYWRRLGQAFHIMSKLVSLSLAGCQCSVGGILWRSVSLPQLRYLVVEIHATSKYTLRPFIPDAEQFVMRHPMLEVIDLRRGADKVHWTRGRQFIERPQCLYPASCCTETGDLALPAFLSSSITSENFSLSVLITSPPTTLITFEF